MYVCMYVWLVLPWLYIPFNNYLQANMELASVENENKFTHTGPMLAKGSMSGTPSFLNLTAPSNLQRRPSYISD